jgi:hypothetical protein
MERTKKRKGKKNSDPVNTDLIPLRGDTFGARNVMNPREDTVPVP